VTDASNTNAPDVAPPHGVRFRYEDFGAILALEDPPALVSIDTVLAQELGYPAHPRWTEPTGYLSAPTEVHLMVTERCPAGCPSCYVDSTMSSPESSFADLTALLDQLARMGVFHVALGGGESLLRDDLFAIAAHARARGLVPNLTTSGLGMTAEKAASCRAFGQVNVSLDGLGEVYRICRGYDGEAHALRALRLLADAGVSTGINLVLQRANWDSLEATVAAAVAAGAGEIEILRFKPAGRAHATYLGARLRTEQNRALAPRLVALMHAHPGVQIKVDCSFIPMLCAANPDPELLARFGVIGCEAGNMLAAVRADGQAVACSFVEETLGDASTLETAWDTHPSLQKWRGFPASAPAPCRSCPYASICRGGCKVVSRHLFSDYFRPDPECPRVIAHAAGTPFVPVPLFPATTESSP
jgi:radical SAM protein with 4Fe4S-binding SPASM domain